MKEDIKFSVIITMYNVESYIARCLESIINQTYSNIEILVVDDGSSDNSLEVVNRYKTDSRLKVITKENGGVSTTRNVGIANATGEYIMFVDGDDYIDERTFEILAKKLSEHPYDIICFNYVVINNGNSKVVKATVNQSIEIVREYIIGQPSPWAKIIKRKLFIDNKITFPEGRIYEDLAVIPSLALYTSSICFIEDSLYYYYIRKGSIMHITEFNENRDDKFFSVNYLIDAFRKHNCFENYKNELEYVYLKNLLIVYSTEILIYDKAIYEKRLNKVIGELLKQFPNWKKNHYLLERTKFNKLYISLVVGKHYSLAKLIVKVLQRIHKI